MFAPPPCLNIGIVQRTMYSTTVTVGQIDHGSSSSTNKSKMLRACYLFVNYQLQAGKPRDKSPRLNFVKNKLLTRYDGSTIL